VKTERERPASDTKVLSWVLKVREDWQKKVSLFADWNSESCDGSNPEKLQAERITANDNGTEAPAERSSVLKAVLYTHRSFPDSPDTFVMRINSVSCMLPERADLIGLSTLRRSCSLPLPLPGP
jgi:hypothetical protein